VQHFWLIVVSCFGALCVGAFGVGCGIEPVTHGQQSGKEQAVFNMFAQETPLEQVIIDASGVSNNPPVCDLLVRHGGTELALRPRCEEASRSQKGTLLRLDFGDSTHGARILYLAKEPATATCSASEATQARRFATPEIAVLYLLTHLGVKMPRMRRAYLKYLYLGSISSLRRASFYS